MMTTKKSMQTRNLSPKELRMRELPRKLGIKRSYPKISKLVKRRNLWELLHFDKIYRKMIFTFIFGMVLKKLSTFLKYFECTEIVSFPSSTTKSKG
ncbi:hypothetical protein DQM28_08310 [Leptospira mayottensis]|uniref:Uncharacterized protein n=1 Tax=Leptospira mayottensis TaxID=1137606 RepID=A0ABM6Y8L0_9LEPT|nr:hypothetical protein DQM28_08310 [Leptospira mayottensis]